MKHWSQVSLWFSGILLSVVGAHGDITPGDLDMTIGLGGMAFEGSIIKSDFQFFLAVDYAIDQNLQLEANWSYCSAGSDHPDKGRAHVHLLGVDALYNFELDIPWIQPYGLAGFGVMGRHFKQTQFYPKPKSSWDLYFEYGLGARYPLNDYFNLRADARHVYLLAKPHHNFRGFIGVEFAVPIHGRITAPITQQPVAAIPPAMPPTYQPPLQMIDSDGDGVPDAFDRCPGTPQGVIVDEFGCPIDSDGDGVPDQWDLCPNTPPGVPVDWRTGCPLEELDSDGDGVPDHLDQCPNTPPGAPVDERGCWSFPGVFFGTNETTLKPEANEVLDITAQVLKNNPSVQIVIEGYTDNIGDERHNREISLRRAQAVRDALIQRGISAGRIQAVGLGPSTPIASNATREGRAKNRRVEITVL